MIGSAVKELTFMAFIENLAPIAFINLVVVILIVEVLYSKKMKTKPELQAELMQMDEKEGHTITEIDLDYIDEVRQKLPLLSARRTDIYKVCYNK